MVLEKILKKKNLNEIYFPDIENYIVPSDKKKVSELPLKNKWCFKDYSIEKFSGKMFYAFDSDEPDKITVNFNLKGYYAIFAAVDSAAANIKLKLSGEKAADLLAEGRFIWGLRRQLCEMFWMVADMTDKKIEIMQAQNTFSKFSSIGYFRFVELTEKEYKQYVAEVNDVSNKRLNGVMDGDMFHHFGIRSTEESWCEMLRPFIGGDFDSLSFEDFWYYQQVNGDLDKFTKSVWFNRDYTKTISEKRHEDLLKHFIEYGKSKGLKMYISMRAGLWDLDAPNEKCKGVDCFYTRNLDCRPIDRDGTKISTLSLAYDKVQNFYIDRFVHLAGLGVDGVELIINRTPITMLFEDPVVTAFIKKYGFDPKKLPLCDERLIEVKCDIFTSFIKRLRNALDDKGFEAVKINLRCLFSLYDNKLQGVDLERLAKERLVHNIMSYPLIQRERYEPSIVDTQGLIDIEKYTAYLRRNDAVRITDRQDHSGPNDLFFIPPSKDYYGRIVGPKSMEERIKEFVALTKKYGVRVYFELLPRDISLKKAKKYVQIYYKNGADGLSFWDSYARFTIYRKFCYMKQLGHKEKISKLGTGENIFFRSYRLLSCGNSDFSRFQGSWGG